MSLELITVTNLLLTIVAIVMIAKHYKQYTFFERARVRETKKVSQEIANMPEGMILAMQEVASDSHETTGMETKADYAMLTIEHLMPYQIFEMAATYWLDKVITAEDRAELRKYNNYNKYKPYVPFDLKAEVIDDNDLYHPEALEATIRVLEKRKLVKVDKETGLVYRSTDLAAALFVSNKYGKDVPLSRIN